MWLGPSSIFTNDIKVNLNQKCGTWAIPPWWTMSDELCGISFTYTQSHNPRYYNFVHNQPVLIMLSSSSTPFDALMWIPSVLGLWEDAITLRLDATTRRHLVNAMCICWLLTTMRFLTFKYLHLWKVMACIINVIPYQENKIIEWLLVFPQW